jgi:hypothetical protein
LLITIPSESTSLSTRELEASAGFAIQSTKLLGLIFEEEVVTSEVCTLGFISFFFLLLDDTWIAFL